MLFKTNPKLFKELILHLTKEAENLSLTELIDLILEETGMKEEYENDKTLESDIRLDNLEEFKSITKDYEERTGSVSLPEFLEEISSQVPAPLSILDCLLLLHSSNES